jgi:ABC-type nitrate/sulfonate/bicarbonate transport system substrate-binding protein
MEKGFFTAQDIIIDRIFAPSSAAMMLQLAAGALDITVEGAFVDTIRGIEKGAPISIVRILVQTPPYELLARPSIRDLKELKGKTISIGGPKDITRIYLTDEPMVSGQRVDLFARHFSPLRRTSIRGGRCGD